MDRGTRVLTAALLGPLLLAGCFPAPPPPAPITIALVNLTALDVRPNLYVSNSATTGGELFVDANLVTDFTDRAFPELRPNENATVTRECDEVHSLGVDGPVLFDVARPGVTRSQDQIFLRRDADFTCGATIRFVFFTEGEAFRIRVEYPQ